MISLTTPHQAQLIIAQHFRQQRLTCMYTQKELAQLSGVPLATLRKFERTGIISLESFLKIASIVGTLSKVLEAVAPTTKFTTIDEMLAFKNKKPRQRVRKS